MSGISTAVSEGMTLLLRTGLSATPVDAKTLADVLEASGKAQIDIAGKIRDGKISPEEAEDLAQKLQAGLSIPAAIAAKAALSRAIEQVFK